MTSIAGIPEQAQLKWVVDVNESRAKSVAAEKGCSWAGSLAPALADPDVQVVIIASTTDTHFPFIMQSLSADKSVLTEKPISHELKEVEEAVKLATSKNLPLYCGYQRRCDKNFRTLKKHVDDGSVGELKVIKCCSRDNPVPPMEYLRTSGGIFHDMLIHDFDMLNWLSGGQEPESVMSVGHAYNSEIEKMGDIDTVAVMLKYPSGLMAMVDTCRDATYGYDQRIEAFGGKGMLTAKNELTSTVELATSEGHLMPCAQWSFPQRYKEAYTTELNEFITMVRAGRSSEHHRLEQEALSRHPSIVRTTIAAELSWKLGRSVDLKDMDGLLADLDKSNKDADSETRSTCDSNLSVCVDEGKNMFGDTFRNYEDSCRQDEVARTYNTMHTKQTVDFGLQQRERWLKFEKGEFTVMEIIEMLDDLIDDSDPDVDLPNSIHDFQTAERIRAQWPEHDWFHLVGLLHDLGKVMALPKFAGDWMLEQWAVVGDTFPVGCAPAMDAIVFPESFKQNPDYEHPVYGTKHGMYQPGCGISSLMFSWGHDEYMYQMLKYNGCTIPEEGLNMIRLHSCYPWHDKRAYTHFEVAEDKETLRWVREFNKFDLYSKGDAVPDVKALKPYYESLLVKYGIGGKLRW
ncbi:unnamed protein product [Prorocentrum cordatum]|uniref:Inositol oxygenase n=1 Tax=Prorocentrum cordatum TaxID=2364126 RepID=A0ABN9W266_9DINO|nr:unnamed protein product [Polarella glacialis]